MPVFSLSDQKDIALEVTVNNVDGDDAHEASVLASIPRSLTYSAYSVAKNVSVFLTFTVLHKKEQKYKYHLV